MPSHRNLLVTKSRVSCYSLLAVTAAVALAFASATVQAADEYAKLPFDASKRSDIKWSKICRGELPLEGNEDDFNAYFTKYLFAEMTDPDKVLQYPKLRKTFYNRYVKAAAQTPAVLAHLNKHTLAVFTPVVAGKRDGKFYHPAARYNAILLIGELDQRLPPATGATPENRDPVPYAEALDMLVKAYRAKAMPEAIKAGALIGIVRHASLNVPSNRRDQLTDVMVELVGEKTPPGGRDPQVHEWLRRRGAETLALLGQPGANNRVAVPLAEVLGDAKSSPTLRCAAADALANLKFENAENLDSAALAKQLGDLATRLCEQQAQLVEDRGVEPTQRELAQQLAHLQHGMRAPLTLAKFSKADGAAIEAIEKELEGTVKMLDGYRGDEGTLKRNLNKWVKDMRAKLGTDSGDGDAGKTPAAEKTKPAKKPDISPEIEVDSN